MMSPSLHFGGIHERDIDLLLFLELASSESFLRWFLEAATGVAPENPRLIELARSALTPTGECDLLLDVDTGLPAPVRLMVENKIDASFQPRQAMRYAARAEQDRLSRQWQSVTTVLLAPADYCENDEHGFDVLISYEQVRAHLRSPPTPSPRAAVVCALIDQAIEKAKLGYSVVADSRVTEFWGEYWRFCTQEFPDLYPPPPTGRPSGSGFVYFQQPSLPPNLRLIHKLSHGFVDLQISGRTVAELHRELADQLESGINLQQRARSVAISIVVPVCDTGRPFVEQAAAVRQAAHAAQRLLSWFDRHQTAVRRLL